MAQKSFRQAARGQGNDRVQAGGTHFPAQSVHFLFAKGLANKVPNYGAQLWHSIKTQGLINRPPASIFLKKEMPRLAIGAMDDQVK